MSLCQPCQSHLFISSCSLRYFSSGDSSSITSSLSESSPRVLCVGSSAFFHFTSLHFHTVFLFLSIIFLSFFKICIYSFPNISLNASEPIICSLLSFILISAIVLFFSIKHHYK